LEQNANMKTFGEGDFSLGHDVVEIPFIWVPDDSAGPRPAYPWFEVGRMTLSAEPSEAPPLQSGEPLQYREAGGSDDEADQ
jgi:hypothetical protein